MKGGTARTYRERLLQVILHIQGHLDEDLPLDDLARLSHFSPYHFHRIFHAMVGEAVHQYVRRLRLERAALTLRQSDTPVVQLALQAGYETHESFTRAFKSMFGVPPSEFRKNGGGVCLPPAELGMVRGSAAPKAKLKLGIKRLSPRRIAFVRHVGPYDQVGAAFGELLEWAAARGLLGGAPTILGVCYDHPDITASDRIRYDAAITVDEDVMPEGKVGVRELPGGDHVVGCHEGPYSELGRFYDYVYGQWLPISGRVPGDAPPFEIYLNDPDNTDPEDLLTDVSIPLQD